MGALATFIVPKLAADQVLQSAELEALCKSVSPGRYDRQINGIVGTVKERFSSRLAQDASLADLPKILSALMPTSIALDQASDVLAEDDGDGGDEFPFKKKAKDAKSDDEDDFGPDEDEEEQTEEDEDEDEGEEAKGDSKKAKDATAKSANKTQSNIGDQDNEEEAQWVGSIKGRKASHDSKAKDAALDAQIDRARTEGADLAISRLAARYAAAEAVKPVIGKIDALACDSAASIYKMALDHKGADLVGVPRVAYKAVFNTLIAAENAARNPKGPKFAQDKAVTNALLEEFKHLPGMA
jgi:cobalamin biosynthesis protein CobT